MFRSSSIKARKYKSTTDDLLKVIEQNSKQIKDEVLNSQPKVPQINLNTMAIPIKIETLIERIQEIQDLHYNFQTEVLDSHIRIFGVLNNVGDKDYLTLPEGELVEPDSALPPLKDEELL